MRHKVFTKADRLTCHQISALGLHALHFVRHDSV
jgi:hypothetical protein